MSEQHVETGKMDEAEEVLDVVFPSGDEAAEVVHPGEESLHFPAFSIAAELATILSSAFSAASIGRNQFDSVLFSELRVEGVRVIGFVPDEPGREFVEKTSGENFFNKLLSAGEALWTDTARGRLLSAATAMIFVPLPRRVGPTAKPLFGARESGIDERLLQIQLPMLCKCRASSLRAPSNLPLRTHCWNRR